MTGQVTAKEQTNLENKCLGRLEVLSSNWGVGGGGGGGGHFFFFYSAVFHQLRITTAKQFCCCFCCCWFGTNEIFDVCQ